ncbi:MAG: hypothetical protein JEZ03_09985 [Bacteroidales bacterium]|nr:hypothetical protein [Bacteroidales bacterium]
MDRRQFIKTGVRTVIAGGLLSLCGFLIFKKNDTEIICDFDFICRNCKQLKACKLPEAIHFRENTKTQNP